MESQFRKLNDKNNKTKLIHVNNNFNRSIRNNSYEGDYKNSFHNFSN